MSLTLIRTISLGAVIVLGATACGGDSAEPPSAGVATLDAGSEADATGEASSDSTADGEDASAAEAPDDPELAFALWDECMADAGFDLGSSIVGDGADDGIIVQEVELDDADPQASGFTGPEDFGEQFEAANTECEKHLANVDAGFELSPEQQAQMEDAQIEWAACMRELGIDVPDFDAGGGGLAVEISPTDGDPQAGGLGDADFDFEAFEEAAKECDAAFDVLNESLDAPAEG